MITLIGTCFSSPPHTAKWQIIYCCLGWSNDLCWKGFFQHILVPILLLTVSDSNLQLHPVFEISDCHPEHCLHATIITDEQLLKCLSITTNEYLMGFRSGTMGQGGPAIILKAKWQVPPCCFCRRWQPRRPIHKPHRSSSQRTRHLTASTVGVAYYGTRDPLFSVFSLSNFKWLHTVFENHWMRSHSTLRAKRATFTFWVDKSWLKMLKMVNFGEFLKK